MENNQPLTIESDVFTELRNAINVMLKNTLEKMISKDGDQAELSGFMGGYEYELIWDPEILEWVMRPRQDNLSTIREEDL